MFSRREVRQEVDLWGNAFAENSPEPLPPVPDPIPHPRRWPLVLAGLAAALFAMTYADHHALLSRQPRRVVAGPALSPLGSLAPVWGQVAETPVSANPADDADLSVHLPAMKDAARKTWQAIERIENQLATARRAARAVAAGRDARHLEEAVRQALARSAAALGEAFREPPEDPRVAAIREAADILPDEAQRLTLAELEAQVDAMKAEIRQIEAGMYRQVAAIESAPREEVRGIQAAMCLELVQIEEAQRRDLAEALAGTGKP